MVEDLAVQYNFKFEVLAPDIDEKAIRFDDPEKLVIAIARAKSKEIVRRLKGDGNGDKEAFILTGDQVRFELNEGWLEIESDI